MRATGCLGHIRSLSGQDVAGRNASALLSRAMLFACGCLSILPHAVSSQAQAQASAVSQAPLSIAIFVTSRKDLCFDPGDVISIKQLATDEQQRINATGGILRRELQLQIL